MDSGLLTADGITWESTEPILSQCRLWDILGEGEVRHIADYAAEFWKQHKRPLRIAVDEANWRFRNLNPFQVEKIREGESAANPIEKVILQRIYRLLRLNIQLIFVDDGLQKPWKRGKSGGKTDDSLKSGTRKLLTQLRVPHHQAPGEAEAECARMQSLGIVDAVWSDDGDSFMFGCGVLIRQHKQGGANVKDHIRIYRAGDLLRKHDMDRESLVLFAMVARGDYVTEGLPGCGPVAAAKIAKRSAGLAHALCRAEKSDLAGWRVGLGEALRGHAPLDFPDFKALNHYRNPVVSTDEQLNNLRGLRNSWDKNMDQASLRVYLRHMFNFTTREFLKHIAPIMVARRLANTSSPEQRAKNKDLGIQLKRTRKVKAKEGEEQPPATFEVKTLFSPAAVVEIDLSPCPPEEDWSKFAAKDGTPYDPTQPVECELLQCLLHHGLPEGGPVEAAPSARKVKRKTSADEGDAASPSAKKRKAPREEQRGSQESAEGKKHGRPPIDTSTAAAGGKPSAKRKKGDKESKSRSPSPPPATFRLPHGLEHLKAKARVVGLCDDEDSESGEPYASDEDPDLALAIQLSLKNHPALIDDTQACNLNNTTTNEGRIISSSSATRASDLVYDGRFSASSRNTTSVSMIRRPQPPAATTLQPPDLGKDSQVPGLVPGETISAQTLRDLRATSSVLLGAASPLASPSAAPGKSAAMGSTRKVPEVIDLT